MAEEVKDLKIVQTEAGDMGKVGFNKWVGNTIMFLRPLAIMYLGFVAVRVGQEGFQLKDLYLSEYEIGGIILYLMNASQDFLRKYGTDQSYIVPKKE